MSLHPRTKSPAGASRSLRRLARRTRGAALVEYSLMLLLILVAGFVAFKQLGLNTRMATDKAAAKFM